MTHLQAPATADIVSGINEELQFEPTTSLPKSGFETSTIVEIEPAPRLPVAYTTIKIATEAHPSSLRIPYPQLNTIYSPPTKSPGQQLEVLHSDNEAYSQYATDLPYDLFHSSDDHGLYAGWIMKFLVPISFWITLQDINSILQEKDITKRRTKLVALKKELKKLFTMLLYMSFFSIVLGTIFMTVTFPSDMNTKNEASMFILILCIILSSFSAVVGALVLLHVGWGNLPFADEGLSLKLTIWTVVMSLAFLLNTTAILLIPISLLISLWKGDGDIELNIAVTTVVSVVILLLIVSFVSILHLLEFFAPDQMRAQSELPHCRISQRAQVHIGSVNYN